jgi:hypothetical protein
MRTCNQEETLHGSVIGIVFILVFGALVCGVTACSSQKSRFERPPLFLFEEQPFERAFQASCTNRPSPPPPPSTLGYVTLKSNPPPAPYARTRVETLDFSLHDVPALTIAAEPVNWLKIAGTNQDHWTLNFCAKGEGDTAEEASSYLQRISMQRTGSLLTLNNTDARGRTGGQGTLLLGAPVDAPITVHSDASIEVHDMAGPVRISAASGRATILNTSGLVNASADIVDFAGSQGSVSLNAFMDIDIRLTTTKFRGSLNANAQRQVLMFFPPGFQTPVEVIVKEPKDFVCRADFCSQVKKDRENSLYRFTYGDVANASDRITVRSVSEQVALDTTP